MLCPAAPYGLVPGAFARYVGEMSKTMKQNLTLRTRIMLTYGLGLIIMAGLVFFLLYQLEQINQEVTTLNTTAAIEARLGAQIAGRAAAVQQAVNYYLQQPLPEYRAQVTTTLNALESDLALQQMRSTNNAQSQRTNEVGTRLQDYQQTFNDIDLLLKAQKRVQQNIDGVNFRTNALLNRLLTDVTEPSSAPQLPTLLAAQSNLQSAILALSRMVSAQSPGAANLATSSLHRLQNRLEGLQTTDNTATLQEALGETTKSISLTNELATNLTALQSMRANQLSERSSALQRSADVIAQEALTTLTSSTHDLEARMRRNEQIIIVALIGVFALAALIGMHQAHRLTRPLYALAEATERIHQGQYDQPVSTSSSGELSRLVAAFNRMLGALREQHAEVARQQAAMVERNTELEQALAQLKQSLTERETLADTIRTLSVPIIPILNQVLVVPLVGQFDLERAQLLTQRLLAATETQRARLAILDLTGVAMIDPHVVRWLLQTAQALELLGAHPMLAGIHPEVAQALVASGANLSHLESAPDLRAAVERALRRLPN